MQSLISNQWFVLTGWLGTIIGIVLTIYYARKSKQIKRISYEIKTVNVVSESTKDISSLCVFWNDNQDNTPKQIYNLYASDVYIWNSGNKAIRPQDFPPLDSLSIKTETDCEIYDFKTTKQSDEANNFILQKVGNLISISFDVISAQDGIKVTIFHSSDLIVNGNLIDYGSPEKSKSKRTDLFINVLSGIVCLYLLFIGSVSAALFHKSLWLAMLFLVLCLIILVLIFFVIYRLRKKIVISIPEDLLDK